MPKTSNDLQTKLHAIHQKGYPAYKELRGTYQFPNYLLYIDHVQGDPFASPSSISVEIPLKTAGFPADYYQKSYTRIALQDYLTRQFEQQVNRYSFRAKGSGKSGLISVTHCGQEILERSACQITKNSIIARFFVGFPANGRRINSIELEKIFFDFLPVCVEKAFFYRNQNAKVVEQVYFLAEDQYFLRKELKRLHLTAFVADASILPRQSGVSDKPLKESIPFFAPDSLAIELTLPHKGTIRGLGIKEGITLIVGGGYHGKSTLLNALESGVYNHIAGDGIAHGEIERHVMRVPGSHVDVRAEKVPAAEKEADDRKKNADHAQRGEFAEFFRSDKADGSSDGKRADGRQTNFHGRKVKTENVRTVTDYTGSDARMSSARSALTAAS